MTYNLPQSSPGGCRPLTAVRRGWLECRFEFVVILSQRAHGREDGDEKVRREEPKTAAF